MYDLEIVLPVTQSSETYARRLRDFKKYGLLNVGDAKIALHLLVGTEDPGDAANDWPDGVEVFIDKGMLDHVAAKLYEFYIARHKSQWSWARWHMRVDDDSITDISALMKILDTHDCEKPWYFVTEHHGGNVALEINLAHEMGYGYMFPKGQKLNHELEASIVSRKACQEIFSNEDSVEYMRRRSHHSTGWTDIAFSVAASFVQIYPVDVYFLSAYPYVGDFSLFGGPIAHIHKLAWDINDEAFQCVVNSVDKVDAIIPSEFEGIFNQEYLFGRVPNLPISVVELERKGKKCMGFIKNSNHHNEKLWKLKGNNELSFISVEGTETSRFTIEKLDYIEGDFNLEPGVKHFLRKLV